MTVRRTYPVTVFLIVVNLLAFAWECLTLGSGMLSGNVSVQGLYRDGALVPLAVTQDHDYWRLITTAFLHASALHIGVNMISLWALGRFIEEIAGSVRMIVIYFVSMIVSSLGVVYFSTPNEVTLGASGAIFGLFGALFAIGFKFGKPGLQLVRANLGILVLNLVFTFAAPGISRAAHVAGLLCGFVLTYGIYARPRLPRATVVDARTGAQLESEIESPQHQP